MAGERSGNDVDWLRQPTPTRFQWTTLHPPTPMHNAGEQVHRPDIPYLIVKPQRLQHLTGLLASLNTEIICARSSTSSAALRVIEAGFPLEMGEIAAVIDDAAGKRGIPDGSFVNATGKRGLKPGPSRSR